MFPHLPVLRDEALHKFLRGRNAAAIGQRVEAGLLQCGLPDEGGSHRTPAGLRSAMSAPSQKTSARWVYSSIRCMSWVIVTTVTPWAFSPAGTP